MAAKHRNLMSKKYLSMLLGGTLTMMVVSLLLMSDQIIAGFVLGSEAVAGITVVTPIYSLSAFFGSVIALGVPILYSTEMGKFNKEKADRIFGLGLLMSVVCGLVLFLATWLFGDVYLQSCHLSDEIRNHASGYLSWMRFTILVMPLQMIIGDSVYCDGDVTVSNMANSVQGIGNIVFSVVLSRFMGIRGISLSSFLFNVISILIFLFHFTKKNNSLRFNLYFSFQLLKDVVRYSIIDSSSYLFLAAFTAALNIYVTSHFGPDYLILVSVVILSREFQLLFDGIGEAVCPIFSVYAGEQSPDGLRSTYRLAGKTAIIEGIAVTAVMMILAPFVPSVLDVSRPDLIYWIVFGVRLTALGSVFVSLLYLLTSYYLVIKKIALGLVACALRDFLFSISLVLVMGGIWGIPGMFTGLVVAPALALAALLIYISVRYGRENCPLLLSVIFEKEKSHIFDLVTEPEDIIRTQRELETFLKEEGVDKKTVSRAALLIEEMYMFIRQMNGDSAILCECTVFLKPYGVQIITKDEGISFNMADEDISSTSLSAYTVASYLEKRDYGSRHLTTMSFNRSAFLIRYDA